MLKLQFPAFPISFKTKDGQSFTARFKDVGDPKNILVLVSKNKILVHKTLLPRPTSEVLSWGALAFSSFPKKSTEESENESQPKPVVPRSEAVPLSGKPTKTLNKTNPKPAGRSEVLRDVSTNRDVVLAKDCRPDELYRTAKSADPQKQYLARLEGRSPKGLYVFQVYFAHLRDWSRIELDENYPFTFFRAASEKELKTKPTSLNKSQEEIEMPKSKAKAKPKPKPKAKPVETEDEEEPSEVVDLDSDIEEIEVEEEIEEQVNAPKVVSSKGLGVYQSWGQAFLKFGKKANAPQEIVNFMKKSFPKRKTNWGKWVNVVRIKYNAGMLPGVNKPAEKLRPYK